MVHLPAKFRENTSIHFQVTIRKQTDRQTYRQTDGGVAISPVPGRGGRWNQNKGIEDIYTTSHLTSKWRGTLKYVVENSIKREMKWERIRFLKKNMSTPLPPPPPGISFNAIFFNVGNSIKREENMKYWKQKCIFFQYLKNSLQKIKLHYFHQYQKLYSTPPWHGARTCKVSRKYIHACSSYSVKTKRDGHTDGRTDGQTDGGAAGDNK